MENVLRAAAIYFILWLVFRIAGKRTMSQMTVFDLVMLLVIAEATQDSLIARDASVTAAVVTIGTLVLIDVTLSVVKHKFPKADKLIDGIPILVVDDGVLRRENMNRERVSVDDILAAAREQGLEGLEDVRYAVLENTGQISIVPRRRPS